MAFSDKSLDRMAFCLFAAAIVVCMHTVNVNLLAIREAIDRKSLIEFKIERTERRQDAPPVDANGELET